LCFVSAETLVPAGEKVSLSRHTCASGLLNNIKRLRIEKNYTQEAMALELGMSTSWYNKLENGHKKLTLKQIETIAKILNVPLKEILHENNNVFPPPFSASPNQTSVIELGLQQVFAELKEMRKLVEMVLQRELSQK